MVGFSELAVDFQKCLDQVPLVLNARTMRHHLGHDLLQESVIQGNVATAKFLWEDLVPETRHGLVTRAVARHNLQRAAVGNVVSKGEKREPEVWIAAHCKSRKKIGTCLDTRNLSIGRNAVDDTFGTALVDVVLARKHFEARRIDIEDKIALLLRVIPSKKASPCMI